LRAAGGFIAPVLRRGWLSAGILSFVVGACHNEQTESCLQYFERAQHVVRDVDSSKADRVRGSLDAVQSALSACKAASRQREVAELQKAANQLSGHLAYLEKKVNQRETKALTATELEALTKTGDPDCPKGQAYRHRASGKEIRCMGPQLAEMALDQAKAYFEGRGHKGTVEGVRLKAEYGAELIEYTYESATGSRPANCVVFYPPPGMSWQEAAARVTGVAPNRLEPEKPIRLAGRSVPLAVNEEKSQVSISLGDCRR
jgi:hypothetical protein